MLHICLAVELLYQKKLNSFEHISLCNTFSFLTFYSLISCFCWLFAMCHDSYHRMRFYRNPTEVAYDSIVQTAYEQYHKRRLLMYYIFAALFPLAVSASIVAGSRMADPKSFCLLGDSMISIKKNFFIIILLEFFLVITAAIYLHTAIFASKIVRITASEKLHFTPERVAIEIKRLVNKFCSLCLFISSHFSLDF